MFLNGKSETEVASEYAFQKVILLSNYNPVTDVSASDVHRLIAEAFSAGCEAQRQSYAERIKAGVSNINPNAMLNKLDK